MRLISHPQIRMQQGLRQKRTQLKETSALGSICQHDTRVTQVETEPRGSTIKEGHEGAGATLLPSGATASCHGSPIKIRFFSI